MARPVTPKNTPQIKACVLLTLPCGKGLWSVLDICVSIFSSTTWLKTAAEAEDRPIPADAANTKAQSGKYGAGTANNIPTTAVSKISATTLILHSPNKSEKEGIFSPPLNI